MSALACTEIWDRFNPGELIALCAVTFGCLIAMSAIVGGMVVGIMRTRAKEQTKRELAAYVAEGSLDPDKAVAILNAGMPKWENPDFKRS